MKIKFLLPFLLIPILIIPAFAIPAGTGFDPFCQKKTNDTRTTGADFICELDIFQMKDDITSNSETIISLNNTVNQLTVRINELTLLHYPDPVDVLVPPVPELVPLPEQPLPGDNPEFAPPAPTDLDISAYSTPFKRINVGWSEVRLQDLPRGTDPPTYVVEFSDDGVNWTVDIEKTYSGSGRGQHQIKNVDLYVEYLVRIKAVNEFGSSDYTLIKSAIAYSQGPSESGNIGSFIRINNESIGVNWYAATALFGFDRVSSTIQKSVNYGEFEDLVILGSERSGQYTDIDVIDGNIYSYRIQTTTTNEVQPRSGFNSILFTLDQ